MGHRALVAYERRDGDSNGDNDATADAEDADRYDVHYSHWGAAGLALADGLAPETTSAGPDDHPEIDPTPTATGVSLDALLADHLDVHHHEALYLVAGDETTGYHVLSFALPETDDGVEPRTAPQGVLVAAGDDDAERVRAWFRATKAVVADVVRRDRLSERAARKYLRERVTEWAGDREVRVVPGGRA